MVDGARPLSTPPDNNPPYGLYGDYCRGVLIAQVLTAIVIRDDNT